MKDYLLKLLIALVILCVAAQIACQIPEVKAGHVLPAVLGVALAIVA